MKVFLLLFLYVLSSYSPANVEVPCCYFNLAANPWTSRWQKRSNTVISSHPVQNVQGNTGQSLLSLPPHILLGEWNFLTTSHCSFPSFGLFLIQTSGAFLSLRVNKVVELIRHIMSYFKFMHCHRRPIFKCVKLTSEDDGVSSYWEKKSSHRGTERWAWVKCSTQVRVMAIQSEKLAGLK